MKQTFKLFLYYLSWHTSVSWLVRGAGAALLAAAFIGAFFDSNFAFGCAIYGYICVFGLPYLMLPWLFRSVIANQRLSQLPGFHLKAGIALLLLTIIVSVFLQAVTFVLGLDALPPWTAFLFFVVANTYMGAMQLALPSRYFGQLMGWLPSIGILVSLYYKDSLTIEVFRDWNLLLPATGVILAGWTHALIRLHTDDVFKPAYSFWKDSGREPLQRLWATHDRYPQHSTCAGTLLLGMPDGILPMLQGSFMWVVLFPLVAAGVMSLFSLVISGDAKTLPPFFWMFIVTSGFLASFNTFPAGEMAARARLLWLKVGGDRRVQWDHLEKFMLRYQLSIYFIAACIALLLGLFDVFEWKILFNYMFYIIVFSLFWLYFSLTSRTFNWPNPVKAVMFIACLAFLVRVVSNSLSGGDFANLNITELGFLLLTPILRYTGRHKFMEIDWYQVQPLNLATIYGQRRSMSWKNY